MVRYFHTPILAHGVVVEVHIGALVEAVVWGVVAGWGEVVVHVCEAVRCQQAYTAWQKQGAGAHRVKRGTSPCCGGMISGTLWEPGGEALELLASKIGHQ